MPGALPDRLLTRLSRVTSSGRFLPVVDGLRFLAIAPVVLHHVFTSCAMRDPGRFPPAALGEGGMLEAALRSGEQGVALFLLISGFILALPMAEQRLAGGPAVPLGRYYMRRLTRLEPPYVICMLTWFVLRVVAHGESAQDLLPHLGASLTYLNGQVFQSFSRINFVAWSLEVEVQFYLVAPFLGLVFAIRSAWLRRALLGAGILGFGLLPLLLDPAPARLMLSLPWFLQYFLCGFLLADLHVSTGKAQPPRTASWDLLGLAAWVLTVTVHERGLAPSLTLPLLLLVGGVAAFRGRVHGRVLTSPWIVAIGGTCYTIYLYHYLFIASLLPVTTRLPATGHPRLDWLVQALLLCPVVLLGTSILFVTCEKPFMQRDWPARLRAWLTGRTPPRTR